MTKRNRTNLITLNKYLYANGNPVSYIDPSGLESFLTNDQLKELGNQIHDTIGIHFISQNPGMRKVDLNGTRRGLSIKKILEEADNLDVKGYHYNKKRPDLAEI